MTEIQRGSGDACFGKDFVTGLAIGQVALVPSAGMQIEHCREGAGTDRAKQPQHHRAVAMAEILNIFGRQV